MTTVHAQTGIKLATKPAKTSLLGGHFIYKANGTGETPSSANVVEWVDNDPTLWRHNVHIGSNGIKLRYGETTLSKWDTNSLIFYTPTTTNGITTTAKAIELNSTNGIVLYKDGTNKGLQLSSTELEIFGSSQSTADVTVTSNGINIGNGSIIGADNTVTNYVPSNGFLYLSTKNYGSNLNVATFGKRSNWRLVIGPNFGVTDEGNIYLNGATIFGHIESYDGTIGGWTIGLKSIYKGTVGSSNSASLATSNLSGTVAGKTFTSSDAATTGWRLTVGSNFGVDNTGKLYASGAEIGGKISAESGTIGAANATNKITIGENATNASIYYGMDSLASTNNGFYIGTDGISIGGGKFKVTNTGAITATGLTITGYATTSDNEDAKKVATDFLAKSGSSITLKTGWNSDYMTMTSDGTHIYCNNKALASFTTSGATIQAQNENDKINLSSSGLQVYKGGSLVAKFGSTIVLGSSTTANAVRTEISGGSMVLKKRTSSNDGEYTIASFGESISLSNSSGSIEITSTGINFNTSGSAKGVLRFNGYPILSVQHLKYTKTTEIAAGATWEIDQTLPPSVLNNYTVLGIVGYNFDNGTSVGMSYMNVYECSISSDGTKLYFKARNLANYKRVKGMIVHIYLLVMPKNSQYSNPIDIEYDDDSSSTNPDA